jgi:hypothetical protein
MCLLEAPLFYSGHKQDKTVQPEAAYAWIHAATWRQN